jgi:hypothetical protein
MLSKTFQLLVHAIVRASEHLFASIFIASKAINTLGYGQKKPKNRPFEAERTQQPFTALSARHLAIQAPRACEG